MECDSNTLKTSRQLMLKIYHTPKIALPVTINIEKIPVNCSYTVIYEIPLFSEVNGLSISYSNFLHLSMQLSAPPSTVKSLCDNNKPLQIHIRRLLKGISFIHGFRNKNIQIDGHFTCGNMILWNIVGLCSQRSVEVQVKSTFLITEVATTSGSSSPSQGHQMSSESESLISDLYLNLI